MGGGARRHAPLNRPEKMNLKKIDQAVTLICDQGCTRIRVLIQHLETGAIIQETIELDETERQAVLAELKSIMAIYDLRK